LQGHCALPTDEETRRLELYNQGLTDDEIALLVGCSPNAVGKWRWRRGLPAHRKAVRRRGKKGCPYLDPAEHERRLELYNQGLSDGQIAAIIGRHSSSIFFWRRRCGLPAHQHNDQHNGTVSSGVPMNQVLTPEQCAEMRMFLTALVALRRELPPGQKPDIRKFIAQWRKLRNQLYPIINDAVEKSLKGKPGYVNKQYGASANSSIG